MHLTPLLVGLLALALSQPGRPVTYDEALGLSDDAPAVQGARSAAKEQGKLAGSVSPLVANPTLTLQPGTAKDPLTGEWAFQGEATLLQSWNLSGLPGDRSASLRAEGEQLRAEARAVALSQRLGAAQAWLDLWAAQRSLADSVQEYELAREFAAKMARAAEAGAFTRPEAADAATYAAEAHVAAIAAEGEVTERGYQLAIAMGQEAENPLTAAGPIPAPPRPPRAGWPALVEAAAKLPAVDA
ncbi:MAG: TolC family protein, partial [Anaeromyxobacteraceae bacterium]